MDIIAPTGPKEDLAMCSQDWKMLLIAASKSGHWKVCIKVLQFLRPFIEATKISDNASDQTRIKQDDEYKRLERSVSSAVKCLELRGQYAWAVRVLHDWIEWSGRRPPSKAISACVRILAARGRGTEVITLMQKVLQVQPFFSNMTTTASTTTLDATTETQDMLMSAITHLHKNGLYEEADDVYLEGLSRKLFGQTVPNDNGEEQLDLHGMNVAMAHSAVRIALQQNVAGTESDDEQVTSAGIGKDLVIITGRGKRSIEHFRPVLRPEIQRMLTEEFYPPLSTVSIPGNMGALRVPASDVEAWVGNQRQQRGIRMMTVASMIKGISGRSLQQSILLSLQQKGREKQMEESEAKETMDNDTTDYKEEEEQ